MTILFRSADPACWLVRTAAAAALGCALIIPSFAWSAEAQSEDEELGEVQVTGTRIQLPGTYTAPNPMTTINSEEMRRLGVVNVADALTTLVPQNVSTYMPTMIGDDQAGSGGGGMDRLDRGSFFIGSTIANLRGMDPAFGSRTLTLIDGRRVVSTSNQADVVDMNIVPSNLLQRMDVVTGGASATYGSGAIAGVVNMVLNNRMQGVNLDLDYGINEAGDGASPHVALSAGTRIGEKAHLLLGVEWQKQSAIRDCAAARDWCAESRALFSNNSTVSSDPLGVSTPLPGFETFPARFEMANVRYSQFSPTGAIYHNSVANAVGYRFSADGSAVDEYSYGYRGGTNTAATSGVMNGDGPLVTSGTAMRPSSDRKTLFSNFEYDLTGSTTAYLQANYAKTEGLNKNRYTSGTYCARFNAPGIRGTNSAAQTVWNYGSTFGTLIDGSPYNSPLAKSAQLSNAPANSGFNIRELDPRVVAFLGLPTGLSLHGTGGYNPFSFKGGAQTPGIAWPFWVPVQFSPEPPNFNWNGNAVATYVRFRFNNYFPQTALPSSTNFYVEGIQNDFWLLDHITLTNAYDLGNPTVLPALGRNAYAFLNNLDGEALFQVQNAFNNSPTAGAGAGLNTMFGPNTCSNFTALRKVWNPQVQQWTSQESETMRFVGGLKGRFAADWKWEGYYQYGQTESASRQNDVATNIRLAFAMDAVVDDRLTVDGAANPTYGQPVCRIIRDGTPLLDYQGRPLSDPAGLDALAAGCKPLNIFGTTFENKAYFPGYDAAATQQQALDYAFVESVSSGKNSLKTLSFTTSGTLWQGWGAGPLSAAFGVEVREDKVGNVGTEGDFYTRADLARTWADAFGGKTRVTEEFTELNLPLVTGHDGLNLLAINGSVRYSSYHNKGGAGTTGEAATQGTLNWKFSSVFEPFDFVRFRLTRSQDLRAAGYRDLFLYQPGIPDEFSILNPWRERTALSTENQQERYGQVRVGNSDLKPEISNTLTLGIVLSPGGWAQGMRFSADYYNIRVKDGINTPYTAANPVRACWEQSGNVAATYLEGEEMDPGINGLFDPDLAVCKELAFAANADGSRNLQDLVMYNAARPQNSLPYQRRGLDLSLNYNFPLNRAFESLPGSMSLTLRGQVAMESSGVRQESSAIGFYVAGSGNTVRTPNPDACGAALDAADPNNATFYGNRYTCVDQVGQIRSSTFIPGVQASPKWTGNIITSYLLGDLAVSVSTRYIGGARLDNAWTDDPQDPDYVNGFGQLLNGSVDNNWVKPYFNFGLNGSYDLQVADMKQFQVFGSISNLFDKSPPFTGGGLSGASAQYHDTMGRSYRMGVRMKF